jgi:hypothetical protein
MIRTMNTAGVSLDSTSTLTTGNIYRSSAEHQKLTTLFADDRDRDYTRERSRSPGGDRDGDIRLRDEPSNGRSDRYVFISPFGARMVLTCP